MENDTFWDVIVVGGGPSGMMAATVAAKRGLRVILIEKNKALGQKLLITGGGRCNVTNFELDNRKLLEKFRDAQKFLFSAFSQYSVSETLEFFHSNNMQTKVENELRVFPVSNSAQSVWDVLVENMQKHKVHIISNSPVIDIIRENEKIVGIKTTKNIFKGKSIIIATGGTSRPETGSTGDAYKWMRDLGHTVLEPRASLVPISTKDLWVKKLSGISLDEVKVTLLQNKERQRAMKGKLLFTHVGLSGPTILNMSTDIGELLKYGDVELSLDLLPQEDYSTLNLKLQELFKVHDKKKFQNALPDLIPSALASVVIEISGINPNTQCNSITREERIRVINLLKNIPVQVDKLLGLDKAIITSGGIKLDEIDFKTMRSRLFENLYLIGDMLNIDRPSGGYSLQLCWTTGFVAGNSVEI